MVVTISGPAGETGSGNNGRQPRVAGQGGGLVSLSADKRRQSAVTQIREEARQQTQRK